jgi:hypothetical protein
MLARGRHRVAGDLSEFAPGISSNAAESDGRPQAVPLAYGAVGPSVGVLALSG